MKLFIYWYVSLRRHTSGIISHKYQTCLENLCECDLQLDLILFKLIH